MEQPMKGEIWKPVVGYEGIYEVSNLGRIKSLSRFVWKNNKRPTRIKCKLLALDNSSGYSRVHLHDGYYRQGKGVHRLVLEAFVPRNNNLQDQCNHKNGIKTDNRVENLEWCNRFENMRHARDIGLLSITGRKKVIRSDGKIYNSLTEAAKDIQGDIGYISNICRKQRYYHLCRGFGFLFYSEPK
jgi:hypothetical protein